MNNLQPLQTYQIDNRTFTTPLMIQMSYAIPAQQIVAAIEAKALEGTRIGSRWFVEVGAFETYRQQQEGEPHVEPA